MMRETRSVKILGLENYTSKRTLIIFGKKLIVMTKFPDNGQMNKIP